MQQQSYKNHVRLHPAFHYVLVPLASIAVIGSILNLVPRLRDGMALWYAILLVLASVALALVSILMREYAKKVQDRVVRAEENFRHYVLTGNLLDSRLSLSQIIALRFASDGEFAELCNRAINENMSPDMIKRSIKTWKSDFLRV